MRVVAGKARGTQLKTIESNETRPTKDMVKEALFSILYSKVQDAIFLDLFAGSGAIGIEALSRGAAKAYFSDINKECVKVINSNIEKTHFTEDSVVLLEQVRTIDKQRLKERMGNLSVADMNKINKALTVSFGLI